CPKCGSNVYAHGMAYICEKAVGASRACDFRSGKIILQQEIDRTQMKKLLDEGKTDLLKGFISNRTKRKFSAFLVRQPDGKTGFEFEPRPAKAAAKPAKAAAKATPDAGADAPTAEAKPAKAVKATKTTKTAAKPKAAAKKTTTAK
ncbi:MAG TPA: topoisomerase C-terminal repeat-containing protein, partial [Rhodocyclaceae bacterium]